MKIISLCYNFKVNKDCKISISFLLLLIIVIFITISIISNLFTAYSDEKDYCLDTGICKENLEVNTEIGRIIINKENCIKYKWDWNENEKYCKILKKGKFF